MEISRIYLWAKGLLPGAVLHRWDKMLIWSGLEIDADEFAGFMVINSVLLGLALSAITAAMKYGLLVNISVFFATIIFSFFLSDIILRLIVDSRAKVCESVYPDLLILMASNIQVGIIPDKALALSIRPEFGPLAAELATAARKASTGRQIGDMLREVADRIDSKLIKSSINIIVEGIASGGELSSLLEETARDIKNMELIKSEIRAQVRTYTIFIFFAAILAAPALFSVSIYLADTLAKLSPLELAHIPVEAYKVIPFMFKTVPRYGSEFLQLYCISNILIISTFASLLIGLIEYGDELRGVNYIPVLVVLSLTIFFLTSRVVAQFSGAITGWVG